VRESSEMYASDAGSVSGVSSDDGRSVGETKLWLAQSFTWALQAELSAEPADLQIFSRQVDAHSRPPLTRDTGNKLYH
jgi:hypothetical protein